MFAAFMRYSPHSLMRASSCGCVSAPSAAAFGDDQIPVDTHVFRLANRIGLACADTPEKVEKQLREIIPEGERAHAHHLLIWHGRRCCSARKPACERCPLNDGLCEKKI